MQLFLRVFVEVDAEGVALVARGLADVLAPWKPVAANVPLPYWKIDGWWEVTFDFMPGSAAMFDAIVAQVRDGWTHVGWDRDVVDEERSSVWNAGSGAHFLAPEVRWAELQLIHPPEAQVGT